MSVDISYYAFSPSKADKKWEHFAEDILALRQKHKDYLPNREREEKIFKLRNEEYKSKYEPILIKKRKEFFKLYEDEGLYLPGVDWHKDGDALETGGWVHYPTDEQKMEYMLNYGPMYPKGYVKGGSIAGKFMYIEDKEEYLKLKEEVESQGWDEINKKYPHEDEHVPIIKLTDRQKQMDSNFQISYLTYEHEFNKQRLLGDLKMIDIHYGSIEAELPEPPAFFEPVLDVFGLKNEQLRGELVADSKVWFNLYDSLNNELIESHALATAKETDWPAEDCEVYIRDFFLGIKPLIKFLKDNPEALLTRFFYSEMKFEPKTTDQMLTRRAEKRAEEYKGLIPPVL